MTMARKMMSQMGQGGSPMEMMQKTMAQMSEGAKPPSMDKMMGVCMGMCSEMLNAIHQTNALAVYGTPELRAAFTEWLSAIEAKALVALKEGAKDAAGLAAILCLSEESARYVLTRLAASGKITLVARNSG
jgi:hypothetical protein